MVVETREAMSNKEGIIFGLDKSGIVITLMDVCKRHAVEDKQQQIDCLPVFC